MFTKIYDGLLWAYCYYQTLEFHAYTTWSERRSRVSG